jgi:3-deoxy-D-manno-octulosonic-acid transferase
MGRAASSRPPVRLRFDGEVLGRSAVAFVASPWLLWKKARKVLRNPLGHSDEVDPRRWLCRPVGARRPARTARGPHVAFVGKSYGELRIVERLDEALKARRPDVTTTWCGQMPEFFAEVAQRHPGQAAAPIPFDLAPAVANWLARVRPDVVVFVERWTHPLLVRASAVAGARLVAVNAVAPRREPKGALRRRLETWGRRRTGAMFGALCFQSEEQAGNARPFLSPATRATVTGNLKLDLQPPSAPSNGLARWLRDRAAPTLFVAGSTRRGDEAFVVDAFLDVRRHVPCSLLLAPRQRERMPEVEALLAGRGLAVSRRTRPEGGRADVLLLDTMGELSGAYADASAAFIGGTLRHLGQNIVEPLLFGQPVAFGPARVLLEAEQRAAETAGVGVRVHRPEDLAAHWRRVASDPGYVRDVRERAARFLAAHRGALARTIDVLAAEVDAVGVREPARPTARRELVTFSPGTVVTSPVA